MDKNIVPDLTKRRSTAVRSMRFFYATCLILMLCVCMMVPAMAAGGGATPGSAPEVTNSIESGIRGGMSSAFDLIKAVVTPIAAVVFAINGLSMLLGGQRGMETAKKNMLICAGAIAAVWLAPLVIETVQGWFASVGTGTVFGTS